MDAADSRQVLLQAAQGNRIAPSELQAAIAALERQPSAQASNLEGEWRSVWTSGTARAQQLGLPTQRLAGCIRQRFKTAQHWLETELDWGWGYLRASGPFELTERQRIRFTFAQLALKLGPLPAVRIPLGQRARGWLQTTYLDAQVHIERGDRGGVAAYVRAAS
jgi:hypothetical protein